MKRYAIIVAGGQGLRMGGELPKQFMLLGGQPILMHTLERFASCDAIVLALPEIYHVYWTELCRDYGCSVEHTLSPGGETRFHSVQRALETLRTLVTPCFADLVAIHDGVRPLVSSELIEQCYETASIADAALPALPVVDSLRVVDAGGETKSVDRASYLSVQTPQAFWLQKLWQAYAVEYAPHFTDDASVWEAYYSDSPISIVEGESRNIKITRPIDLHLAELLLSE